MTFDERVLRSIIRRAIWEGKLFELVFTNNGRILWSSWSDEKFKEIVQDELNKGRPRGRKERRRENDS